MSAQDFSLPTKCDCDVTNAEDFQTSAQNVPYDEIEETNKITTKNQNNLKIADFFVKFCDVIMDMDFFACFDEKSVRCDCLGFGLLAGAQPKFC